MIINLTKPVSIDGVCSTLKLQTSTEKLTELFKVLETVKANDKFGLFTMNHSQQDSLLSLLVIGEESQSLIEHEYDNRQYSIEGNIESCELSDSGSILLSVSVGFWCSAWHPDGQDTFKEDSFYELDSAEFIISKVWLEQGEEDDSAKS